MKKAIKRSVALVCVLANAISLFACGHTHSYTTKVVQGTCQTQGYTLHTCECGDSYQDEFTGYGDHVGGEATCEFKAECELCGEPYGEYAPHDYQYSVCTVCWKNEGSEGLNYALNEDGESYSVVGSGYCAETHVSIPNYYDQKPVTAIADYAFYHSITLVELTISKNIESIGVGALSALVKAENIIVAEGNENYKAEDGVLYTKDGKTLVAYPGAKSSSSYRVHDGVETISARAFEGAFSLSKVELPEGVKAINDKAFHWSSVSDVNIPSSVTYIGENVYDGKAHITAGGLKFIGHRSNRTVAISGVDSEAETLTIPYGTTAINAFVFQGAAATTIEVDSANERFSSIEGDLYSKDGKTLIRVAPGKNSTFTVPSTVTEIADGAFAGCNNLSRVYIPSSVEKIGANTFDGCYAFQLRLEESDYLAAWFDSYDACDVPVIYGAGKNDSVSALYYTYYEKNEEVYLSAPTINDATATVTKIEYRAVGEDEYTTISKKTQGYKFPTTQVGWTNILYTLGDIKYKAAVCIRDGKLYEDFEDDNIYNGGQNYYSAPDGGQGVGAPPQWKKVEVENNNHAMMIFRDGQSWEGFHYTSNSPYIASKTFSTISCRIWSSCILYDYALWTNTSGARVYNYVDLAQGWNDVTIAVPESSSFNSITFYKSAKNPTILIDDVRLGV